MDKDANDDKKPNYELIAQNIGTGIVECDRALEMANCKDAVLQKLISEARDALADVYDYFDGLGIDLGDF